MALRDEIKPNTTSYGRFDIWLSEQPNSEEWLDVIDDKSFSHSAVCELLIKYGFPCDANFVHRLRRKRAHA